MTGRWSQSIFTDISKNSIYLYTDLDFFNNSIFQEFPRTFCSVNLSWSGKISGKCFI